MIRLSIDQQVELMDAEGLARFSRLWLLGESGRYMSDDVLANAYDDALSAIIEGHDDRLRDEIARTVADREPGLLDRVTAELAAHACCDPLTAVAIAMQLDGHAVIEDAATDEDMVTVDPDARPDHDRCGTVVWVAPGVVWHAIGALRAELPDTAHAAAVGRPLRDVVSHPVLDRHALTVIGVGEDDDGRLLLMTDADRRPLTARDLAAIRPPGATTTETTP